MTTTSPPASPQPESRDKDGSDRTPAPWQRWLKGIMELTMLAGLVWSVMEGNYLQAVVVGLIIVATALPNWLSRYFEVRLPPEFELAAIVFLYASLFLGEFGNFYHRFWWWDVVLHIGSGFLLGLAAFVLIFVLNGSPRVHLELSPIFLCLFTFTFAVAAGTLWEIFEFTMDRTFKMNMQKSGLMDTMGDLIVDAAGALVISALGYAYLRFGHESFLVSWVQRFLASNPRLLRRRSRPAAAQEQESSQPPPAT